MYGEGLVSGTFLCTVLSMALVSSFSLALSLSTNAMWLVGSLSRSPSSCAQMLSQLALLKLYLLFVPAAFMLISNEVNMG